MVSAERFAQGMTVPEYVAQMVTNREAFARLLTEAPVRPEDRAALSGLGRKIKILVITEDWCPDSLRTIPVLARLVDGLPQVEMRLFLRDRPVRPGLRRLLLVGRLRLRVAAAAGTIARAPTAPFAAAAGTRQVARIAAAQHTGPRW